MTVAARRRALLAWYDANQRTLPWRSDSDPYRVWISEAMLQQTRVETVLRYYTPWLERFSDVHALAAAPRRDVMAAWAGLGYYGRARRLHEAAQIVSRDGMPDDVDGLRALPGFGPYMAGAVASIAFGQPVPAVDGNVVRIMARWEAIEDPVDRAPGRRRIEAAAAQHVPDDRPGDWNQALMDLGATVCTPKPRCDACPVASWCEAREHAEALPVKAPKRRPSAQAMHFALLHDDEHLVLVERPDDGLLAGTWMLPGGDAGTPLDDHVHAQTGIRSSLRSGGAARHVFTHRVWDMQVHVGPLPAAGLPDGCHRVPWDDLDQAPVSTACRKAIDAARPLAQRR